jgi:hypothetical protein
VSIPTPTRAFTPSQPGPAPAEPGPAPDTGDDQLDQALGSLADLAAAPVHEHPERLAAVHAVLQRALDPDNGPGSTRA